MSRLRILVVDDEPLARERVRRFLQAEPEFELIGECANGAEAPEATVRGRPDVVILDVEMAGRNGLELAAELSAHDAPAIVFVTAHDRFAVQAFALQAVDYVLKPFDRERLRLALQRATAYVRTQRAKSIEAKIAHLLSQPPRERKPARLAVKADGKVVFIRSDEIVSVQAANNYSILHLADKRRVTLREAIGALARRLGEDQFARINRSTLVRIECVRELQTTESGGYVVTLHNGQRFGMSRQLRGRLELFLPE